MGFGWSGAPLSLPGGRRLVLDRPQVAGILNVTPDSFSDGGKFCQLDAALAQADKMVQDGASVLDIGGESTRPGAKAVSTNEELDRVLPVIEAILSRLDVVVSVDTSTPEVMRGAVSLGAHLINDVRALSRPEAMSTVVELGVPVILMHMQGQPGTMQQQPVYGDVVEEVLGYLAERVRLLESHGFARDKVLIDPGFGFGKDYGHNVALFRQLERFVSLGFPVMVGVSRKRMIGTITGQEVPGRVTGSVVAAVLAVQKGATLLRVHDVAETVEALKVLAALE